MSAGPASMFDLPDRPVAGSTLRQNSVPALLRQVSAAMWARKGVPDPLGLLIKRFLNEIHLASALRAGVDLAPNGVLDPPLGLAVGVQGLVHPAQFLVHLFEQLPARRGEGRHVEGQVVVGGDEGRRRRQVVQDDAAGAPAWEPACGRRRPVARKRVLRRHSASIWRGRRPVPSRTTGPQPRSCPSRQKPSSTRSPGSV